MKLEEIYYFSVKQVQHPELFAFAQAAVEASDANPQDRAEMRRRLYLLTRSKGAEHVRQCSNFLAELGAFVDLINQGIEPHWLPASKVSMPDLEYGQEGDKIPVEVKHLNSPRKEHDALFNGRLYGGNVNNKYEQGLQKKILDFINDARKKFVSFNRAINGINSAHGKLYLFFSKSIDAGLLDGIEWEQNMEERVQAIAERHIDDDIELIITDIDSLVQ